MLIVKDLAIRRRVSRLNYSQRCAEASMVYSLTRNRTSSWLDMEIGYMARDAGLRWSGFRDRLGLCEIDH
jgi:hypothetical protein